MNAANLLPHSMKKHMEKIWIKLVADRAGIRSQNENITREGKLIHCEWFNTPIFGPDGIPAGVLSLVEDITERLQVEKEQLKIEKLESAGLLAGGIAHDFNNILTAILGNINISLLDRDLPQSSRKLLQAAEKATMRARTLTQQLLTTC